jgi:hypothetical protein
MAYLILGFLALFCFRLFYGYKVPLDNLPIPSFNISSIFDDKELSKRNYASEKLKVDRVMTSQSYSVDQKYEKIASLVSKTQSFEDDEKKVRDVIKKYNSLIQFEQSSGLKNSRQLGMAIGVPPDKFDSMVEEVKTIGTLTSIRVDKTDKTNEYKDLNAKRVSLEKARDSLSSLKGRGGSIEESINLESKILELESELQATGVKLGEFDQENEFCTVKFELHEQRRVSNEISFMQRVKVAFEWTVKYYILTLGCLLIGLFVVLMLVHVIKVIRSDMK